jgi:hypothetical protein
MKKYFLLLLALLPFLVSAQYPNWGWGPAMTVSMSGSTANLSVYDPFLSLTKTTSVYSVDVWQYEDGVFAWVTTGGTVGGVTYDVNTSNFQSNTFFSSSAIDILNRDGVIAFVSAGGTVGGAIYDPRQRSWEYNTFFSSSSIEVLNEDGVIAFVSAGGTVGGAVYDPVSQSWEYNTFFSSSSISAATQDGVIAFVSGGGTVGGAVYDIQSGSWKYNTFFSSSSISAVTGEGVIGFISGAGTVGGAVYDHFTGTWEYNTFSSSGSNSGLSVSDGTVYWISSSGSEHYGYNISSGNWVDGYQTDRSCRYFVSHNSGPAPLITYLWCMSIGAGSYTHSCGDGHSITRRWGWKQYDAPGSYSPELTIYSSIGNSTCTGSVSVTGVGVEDALDQTLKVYPNPVSANAQIFVEAQQMISGISILDVMGRELHQQQTSGMKERVDLDLMHLSTGIYFAIIHFKDNRTVMRRIVLN